MFLVADCSTSSNSWPIPVPPALSCSHRCFNKLVDIPPEIGLITSLRSLNLQHNKLISVPKELFLLKGLTDLLLDSNQLLFLPAEALSKVASYNLFRAQNNPFPAIRALTGEVGSPHHASSPSSSSSRSDNNNDGDDEEEEERGGKKVKEEEEEQAVEEPHWWKYEIEKGKPPPWAPLPSLLVLCAQNVFRHYSLKQAKKLVPLDLIEWAQRECWRCAACQALSIGPPGLRIGKAISLEDGSATLPIAQPLCSERCARRFLRGRDDLARLRLLTEQNQREERNAAHERSFSSSGSSRCALN
ncbi:hypothetical protein QOT17_003939 [Balamuthia mandrillaris]